MKDRLECDLTMCQSLTVNDIINDYGSECCAKVLPKNHISSDSDMAILSQCNGASSLADQIYYLNFEKGNTQRLHSVALQFLKRKCVKSAVFK